MSTKRVMAPAALMAMAMAAAAQAEVSEPTPSAMACSPSASALVKSGENFRVDTGCTNSSLDQGHTQRTFRVWSTALGIDQSSSSDDSFESVAGQQRPSGRYRIDVSYVYSVVGSSSGSSSALLGPYIRTGSVEIDYRLNAQLTILAGSGQVPRAGVPLAEDFVVGVGDTPVRGVSRPGDTVKAAAIAPMPLAVSGEQVRWYTFIQGDEANRVLLATTTTDSNGHARYRFTPPDENPNRVVVAELPNAARVTIGGVQAISSVQFALGGGLQQEDVNRLQAQAEFMRQSMLGNLRTQFSNVQQRLRYLRLQESRPGFRNELRVRIDKGAVPVGGNEKDKRDDAGAIATYLMGDINVQELAGNGQGQRVDISTRGLTFGGDYRLNRQLAFGGALGYTRSGADLAGGAGEQKANGGSFSLYGLFAPSNSAYVDLAIAYGRSSFDLERLQSIGGYATGSTDGTATGFTLSGGYDLRFGSFSLTPFAKAEYIDARIDGYTESGSAAVAVTSQQVTATTFALGVDVQYAWSTSWGVVIPHARLDWQRQEQRDKREVTASLVGSNFFANLPLRELDQNYGNLGLGVSAQFSRGVAAFLDYERTFARQNVQQYRTMAGVKVEF